MSLGAMRAMLVSAGFGTRLAPLTELLPKPAVPVANRPVVWFALDHLRRCGLREFVLNTHHLAAALEREVRAAAPPDVALTFVHEPEILGTGGGVHNAWASLPKREHETFLIMNGKYVFAPDIAAALALHERTGALATMIVKRVTPGDPLGAIGISDDGTVISVPGYAGIAPRHPALYTGISLLDARALALLPERGCLIREGYARWLERGERIMAYVEDAPFRDVGMSLRHYLEANLALASGRERWPGIEPDAGGVLCASDARVGEGVQLRESVIGAGAQGGAGVELERCVVWPGAHATESRRDSILLPDGRVVTPA
jgi:NDP-sugar pyrophosphorylase family protein